LAEGKIMANKPTCA